MKKQEKLRIYCLSQPLLHTEWSSLLSDKYLDSLPFTLEFVDYLEEAQVVAWDGVLTPKGSYYMEKVIQKLKGGSLLLLMGEGRTLFKDSHLVDLLKLDQIRYVELPGWGLLPEDVLGALEVCFQKVSHV